MNHWDAVIIGGGVSGLAAGIRLAEAGVRVLLLESGTIPQHRICGEFFSPESLSILDSWGIHPPIQISNARIQSGNIVHHWRLPHPAGGMSRFLSDRLLLERYLANGGDVRFSSTVTEWLHPEIGTSTPHLLTMKDGVRFQADHLIVATGKHSVFAQKNWRPFKAGVDHFIGMKAHFSGIQTRDLIQIHCVPGGYLGFSEVENDVVNVSSLATSRAVKRAGGPDPFMMKTIRKLFPTAQMVFEKWMVCGLPPYGVRRVPVWERTYFSGDAIGAITPICGDGLSMALYSGILAADHLMENQWSTYSTEWRKLFSQPIHFGNWVQWMFFQPILASTAIRVSRTFPVLSQKMFELTRMQDGSEENTTL